jgi:hypothetical protein
LRCAGCISGFRVEHGALVLVKPRGCAAAYVPGCWRAIEEADADAEQ